MQFSILFYGNKKNNFTKIERCKHCMPEMSQLIKKLISQGKTYAEVQNLIDSSPPMIRSALKYDNKPERHGRKSVMSPKLVEKVLRHSRDHPFTPEI